MAGSKSAKTSNVSSVRKRVDAQGAASLKRARDGSAFVRCEECNKDVAAALISMHNCSLEAKLKLNLESQVVESQTEIKKKPRTSEPSSKKGKKEKQTKDPNKLKRPPTAFFVFMDDFRKEYKEANPDNKSVSVVGKQGGEKWKSMTDEEKKPYLDKAAELKEEYKKAIEAQNDAENEDEGGSPNEEGAEEEMGTLETFVEERETVTEREPYLGGNKDEKEKGPELGIWELDLRSEFPVLFTPHKESRTQIPHSELVVKCSGCEGRGDLVCPSCNAGQEPGFYKENQMSQCFNCYGRGLIAHRDGSDTICVKCNGKGQIPCATCRSRGLVKCETCSGSGSILTRKVAVVRWKTASTRKVSATSGAASVPDEVFHRARGVQLCNTQAYQCTPAYFADSFFLNRFSSEVIADRVPVPPTARVICERHTISVVPVTRVTMKDRNRSFSFYIIGFSREVYLKDYYPARFCWGLCPCLEWLKL